MQQRTLLKDSTHPNDGAGCTYRPSKLKGADCYTSEVTKDGTQAASNQRIGFDKLPLPDGLYCSAKCDLQRQPIRVHPMRLF